MAYEVLYCTSYGGYELSNQVIYQLYKLYPDMFPTIDKNEYVNYNVVDEDNFTSNDVNTYVRDNSGLVHAVYAWVADFKRTDEKIINLVKSIGLEESSGENCKLAIQSVPDGYDFRIDEHDGEENVIIFIDHRSIIKDLVEYYKTGTKNFKCVTTQKIIDGIIKI